MKDKNIYKIEVWTRGKNRDEYGNPYVAYKAVIHLAEMSYARTMTFMMPMFSWDNYPDKILQLALLGINRALDLDIQHNDPRITLHYKHVYRDADLEHPENWKKE